VSACDDVNRYDWAKRQPAHSADSAASTYRNFSGIGFARLGNSTFSHRLQYTACGVHNGEPQRAHVRAVNVNESRNPSAALESCMPQWTQNAQQVSPEHTIADGRGKSMSIEESESVSCWLAGLRSDAPQLPQKV
jgi:hypothetical protein